MRRHVLALSALFAATPSIALAQANDYGGLRIFTSSGGAPTPLACGTPFTCSPASFAASPGETVTAVVLGETNGLFLIAASFDTQNLLCLPLGIPGVVHELALVPGGIFVLAIGSCSLSDNGRCNGGSSGAVPLFTLPFGFTGSLAFQGLIATPLSGGGSGLAFSSPVVMNF